jgi:glycosyltransferase involved in cell wall biosynthesis
VGRVLAEARVGLALYHPVQAHIDCLPTKVFEYMAAGLPVITADFPDFRRIVEASHCGLCVPPRDTAAIAAAIEWIFDNPAEAAAMGRRGRTAALNSYS